MLGDVVVRFGADVADGLFHCVTTKPAPSSKSTEAAAPAIQMARLPTFGGRAAGVTGVEGGAVEYRAGSRRVIDRAPH